MGNLYAEMKKRQSEETNALPIVFAFDEQQLEKGMRELGLEPHQKSEVCGIGFGGICRKTDVDMIVDTLKRHKREQDDAVLADVDGTGFTKDMFKYELANHEYTYTLETEETIEALGYDVGQVESSPKLRNALETACKELRAAEGFEW